MGNGSSLNLVGSSSSSSSEDDVAGGQLYVCLEMEDYSIKGDLVPHVYGSVPLVETLDFKFLLKSKNSNEPCIVEEGPTRQFMGGTLQGVTRLALFRPNADEILEYRVCIKAHRVSPFDLAASWRAYQENLEPSTVRGIPDVSINTFPEDSENGSSPTLDLDLEQYLVPIPPTSVVYAANLTENPRSMKHATGSTNGGDGSASVFINPLASIEEQEQEAASSEMETAVLHDVAKVDNTPGMFESKSMGTSSPIQRHNSEKRIYIDRGVGASPLVKSASEASLSDSEAKVGLPARGKTFTAAKLTRYLRWLGHDTKHFNVGKYRRLKHGANLTADFFRGDNTEGMEARNEVAALAMDDMIAWMQEGGQVGIFDATNSSSNRRNMLMKMAEGKCKVAALAMDDMIAWMQEGGQVGIFDATNSSSNRRNMLMKMAEGKCKMYEPVNEGSYIKMIDMASGKGGQIQVNNLGGYLPGRIVFFLVNAHLTPRPILLTRHGESRDNVRGRIGGDPVLSEKGELYAKKLANFVKKRFQNERAASIWTSTLQRTILSANPIAGFPKVQWRALDEINAGVCDGMTYEEIKKNMPDEYESRKKDKLRYRYPRGESYLDVIQRLEPVIIELERQRAPVVVVSHQAVLRALYAYFADRPLKEIPHIERYKWESQGSKRKDTSSWIDPDSAQRQDIVYL
ncbi:phosphoglycerate/bisphosphoglycerate mutase, active site protein [Artemisia annua]|uniref:Phosphoglycerate/bisphosphoglycerate mutase, active site protein n=1 Tax=Artemisia annua TaxID=35608 RepID=A0A2U1N0H0_ARTAN|nr:phosphoglycerate/bisphosphoglycerate mutase, active site protein [Artemisia annua]